MKSEIQDCNVCSHVRVCNIKENYSKLKSDIKVMPVYSPLFEVSCKCTQFNVSQATKRESFRDGTDGFDCR